MAKRPVKQKRSDLAGSIEQALGGAVVEERRAKGEGRQRKHFTSDEFIAWAEANCYRDDKALGWVPLTYTAWQKRELRGMMELREDGTPRFVNWMFCWPRRCGKSEGAGVYDICRALKYDDQMIVIQGNSEDQGLDTVLKEIVDKLLNSPRLKARVKSAYGQAVSEGGDITITEGLISFLNGSVIKVQPAKEATTYGQKIHVYHNTEGCKAASDKLYQTGASSTGDAWCAVSIIDSNMGDASNFVCVTAGKAQDAAEERQRAAEEKREANPAIGDPSTYCSYLYFEDLADVLKRGCGLGLEPGGEPIHPWLSAEWIRSRCALMIRSEFLRNHCNKPSGQGDELWSAEQVDPLFLAGLPEFAMTSVALTLISRIIGGDGRWRIGVGLDRALATSRDPDRTVLACVGRTTIPAMVGVPVAVYDEQGKQIAAELCDGSAYVLLAAWEYRFALRDPLQAKIGQIDRALGIGGMNLEQYQASDLYEWCQGQRFGERTTIRHMTAQAKQQLVQFGHGLITTRRFFAPCSYHVLRAEITNYREDASGGGISSFGGSRKTVDLKVRDARDGHVIKTVTERIKDDYWEATLWAADAASSAKVRSVGAGVYPKPPGF